jgi:hypothetical protein
MPSNNAVSLENAVVSTLARGDRIPSEAEVLALATALRAIPNYSVSDEDFLDVMRRLHARLQISMDTGTAIAEPYQPWLPARKAEIDPYYWNRYADYLRVGRWPPRVISTMDRVTDDILGLLGNPAVESAWERRGLVMGDVQSGKTSPYAGLICKAADAGYRLVILLTGTMENLRRQTQERLDAGFVGLDSSGLLSRERTNREVGVGLIDRTRTAGVFTSRSRDFSTDLMNQLGFRLNAFREPVLLVVKKNKRILDNLAGWLRSYNAGLGGVIDTPMLLIDDEADNASINTNPDMQLPTAINERIRTLLHLFTRSSYVGFTATPFANIFIDPDTEDQMRGNDLFPRDFIYALEAPTNYLGARVIFGEDGAIDCLRSIEDADLSFPAWHRIDHVVGVLPESLLNALRVFLVANALRDLRNEGPTHRSMLVNVSRFTNVQNQITELIDDSLRQMQQDIRNFSQLPPREACRNRTIADLKRAWETEFPEDTNRWETVQAALLHAALPVVVRCVNQRTGAASLDYAAHRTNGLRVVAVGGNSLSRGLTLEGLCVSYFYRNSQMYDTLMQMGRWFGYRDGYSDLCRIWLADEAIHWYRHISLATEELRSEIRKMRAADLTPKDFGLKVRSHPESLIVTARNKMRTAQEVERVISVSGEGLETPRLLSNQEVIRANAMAAEGFIRSLGETGLPRSTSPWGNTIWYGVPRRVIADFLRSFTSHPLNATFQTGDLAAFLETNTVPALGEWDVVIPNGSESTTSFAGVDCKPQKRRVDVNPALRSVLVSGKSARVGSRGIEKEGLPVDLVRQIETDFAEANPNKTNSDKEYRSRRTRPLLLLHLIKPTLKDQSAWDAGGSILVALGLSFPMFDDTDETNRRVRYRVNLVEWRNLFDTESEEEMESGNDNV